jgi:hypothetical protein
MGLPLDVGCDRYEVKPKRATIAGHADGPVHIMQTGGQLEIDAFVRSIIQVEGGIFFKKSILNYLSVVRTTCTRFSDMFDTMPAAYSFLVTDLW